jgi:hypothetical protein
VSVVTLRPCEFCGTEFLRRLSGPEGVYGSRSTCPSCGKAPTPPVPRSESLRPATEMFPGLKVERATAAPFIIESATPEPLRAPRFKIFEMDSSPGLYEVVITTPKDTLEMAVEVDPPQTRQLKASWVDGGPITCGNENCVRTGECWCGRSA